MPEVWEALGLLQGSSEEGRRKCLETVRLLLTNVLERPTESKFRRIRLENPRYARARRLLLAPTVARAPRLAACHPGGGLSPPLGR